MKSTKIWGHLRSWIHPKTDIFALKIVCWETIRLSFLGQKAYGRGRVSECCAVQGGQFIFYVTTWITNLVGKNLFHLDGFSKHQTVSKLKRCVYTPEN